MTLRRPAVVAATVALAVATLSNALSLSVIGLDSYFEGEGGYGEESGRPGHPGIVPEKPDVPRRKAVERRIPEEDWAKYTPHQPGIPSLVRGGVRTAREAGFEGVMDDRFAVFYAAPFGDADARLVLAQLSVSAERIAEVFGVLPEQSAFPGRKIAVYLPGSREDFDRWHEVWGGRSSWRVSGFCAMTWDVSSHMYLVGLFLPPEVTRSSTLLPAIVTHELAHYAFSMSWDVGRRPIVAGWFSEGLAEYTARNFSRLREIPSRLEPDQSLVRRSPPDGDWRVHPDVYWIGFSAFLVLEDRWGDTKVREVLRAAAGSSTHLALGESGISLATLDAEWQRGLPELKREPRLW